VTLSIITLNIMTLSIMALSIMALSIMALSIMALSIMVELLCCVSFMPGVMNAECHRIPLYAECRYAECNVAENASNCKRDIFVEQVNETRPAIPLQFRLR
jgi:hypothetical protein